MRNYKPFLLIWLMVLMTSPYFLLVTRTLHRTPSGTTLISSTEQAHDVCEEVRSFTGQEILPQIEDGRECFHSLRLGGLLAVIAPPLLHSINLTTESDQPSGITMNRLFVRKFSPPESDDDFLLS